jgi:hypothetical protein
MTISRKPIPLQLDTVVNGRKWLLYSFDFTTSDGEFSTYFYAISDEHAAHILEELKATARNPSCLEGWEPA